MKRTYHNWQTARPWTVNRMEETENCFQLKLAGVHTDFPEEAKFARQNWQEEGET